MQNPSSDQPKEVHDMAKREIVELIVKEYGGQVSSYYNTATKQERPGHGGLCFFKFF